MSNKVPWATLRDDELIYMYYPFDPLYNCFIGHNDYAGCAMSALDEVVKLGMTQYRASEDWTI